MQEKNIDKMLIGKKVEGIVFALMEVLLSEGNFVEIHSRCLDIPA
jgi:hypothetical protein